MTGEVQLDFYFVRVTGGGVAKWPAHSRYSVAVKYMSISTPYYVDHDTFIPTTRMYSVIRQLSPRFTDLTQADPDAVSQFEKAHYDATI